MALYLLQHCGACEKACPNKAIHIDQNGQRPDRQKLVRGCGNAGNMYGRGAQDLGTENDGGRGFSKS
jgi:ferredoxin